MQTNTDYRVSIPAGPVRSFDTYMAAYDYAVTQPKRRRVNRKRITIDVITDGTVTRTFTGV